MGTGWLTTLLTGAGWTSIGQAVLNFVLALLGIDFGAPTG